MTFLHDLPEAAKERLAEVMADPHRRMERVVRAQSGPAACGTRGGYNRHRRNNEPTCDACKMAERLRHQKKAVR